MDAIKGAKVLVAEDNVINQVLVEGLLTEAGLGVVIAENGKKAVELAGKAKFDLILMDLQMPEMDGFDATRTILEQKSPNHPPIIAMTANAMARDRERCLGAGMVDHIAKPIEPKVLFDTLLKWIPAIERGPSMAETQKVMDKRVSLPKQLAGIDIAEGIQRANGNPDLYITFLRHFVKDHGKDNRIISQAVIRNDTELAHRTAHTLKGVAGVIGAQELYDSSRKVETALRKKQLTRFDALMENLAGDLTRVVEDLKKKILPQSLDDAEKIVARPIDMEKLRSLLVDFLQLAKEMDPDIDCKAQEINRLLHLHDSPLKEISVALLDYAENLDFDKAIETLEKLKKTLDSQEPL